MLLSMDLPENFLFASRSGQCRPKVTGLCARAIWYERYARVNRRCDENLPTYVWIYSILSTD